LSRRGLRVGLAHAGGVALLFIVASPPAVAQDAANPAGPSAESMAARAKAAYGPLAPQRPKACGTQDKNGEIVVCAPDDGKQWRIPSTSDSDPTSRQATRTGVPRAPQLDRGSCKGKGQLGCIGIGRAAVPMYMIDLSAIPQTPKDSDAEKVAKGEMSDR
jgi:hypothetical protein